MTKHEPFNNIGLAFVEAGTYDNVYAIVAAATVAALLARRVMLRSRTPNESNKPVDQFSLPPFPSYSFFETGENLSNGNLPWFFLACADQVGNVFRLNVPVMPGGMYVVGNGRIQSAIMSDSKTTKPIHILKNMNFCFGGLSTIITSEGSAWKHRIKAISPAFASNHIKRMDQICESYTEKWLQERIEPLVQSNESFDIGEEMVRLTISVIARAGFEYNMTSLEAQDYVDNMTTALNEFQVRSSSVLSLLFGSWWNARGRKAILATQKLHGFARRIINSYRASPGHTRTLIHCIVNNPNYSNDDERAADITVFFLAGHDTTGNSIAWAVLELAKNPSELEHLRDSLSKIPRQEWKNSPALQNIIREGMRLHPAVAGGPLRTVGKDFQIPERNLVIPKGSNVLLSNILSGRDPAVFENPNGFLPSRWNNPESWNKDFFPFATSRHSCPGQALANAEIPTVIAALVEKYNLQVTNSGGATFDATTMRPVGAMIKATKV